MASRSADLGVPLASSAPATKAMAQPGDPRKTGRIHPLHASHRHAQQGLTSRARTVLAVTRRGTEAQAEWSDRGHTRKRRPAAPLARGESVSPGVLGLEPQRKDITEVGQPRLPESVPVRSGWSAARDSGTCSGRCNPWTCTRPCGARWRTGSTCRPLEGTRVGTSSHQRSHAAPCRTILGNRGPGRTSPLLPSPKPRVFQPQKR